MPGRQSTDTIESIQKIGKLQTFGGNFRIRSPPIYPRCGAFVLLDDTRDPPTTTLNGGTSETVSPCQPLKGAGRIAP